MKRTQILLLLLVITVAVVARLSVVNLSIEGDEAFSLRVAQLPWSDLNREVIGDFVHPPLHYYLLHLWFSGFGFGILGPRALSVIFGTLSVAVLYRLGSRFFSRDVGLLSASLLAVSQFAALYSQEARPYAMEMFLALCATYLFFCVLHEPRLSYWVAFVIMAILMMYTLYYSFFVLLVFLVFLILSRRRHRVPWSWIWVGTALIAVAFLPWLTSGIIEAAAQARKTTPDRLPYFFQVRWSTFVTLTNRFNNGGLSEADTRAPLWAYAIGASLFTLPALRATVSQLRQRATDTASAIERDRLVLLTMLWLLPIVIVIALGAFHVQYQARYVLFCLSPYYILVSAGLLMVKPLVVRRLLLAVVFGYSFYALVYQDQHPVNAEIRGAQAYVHRLLKSGDCVVFYPLELMKLQWKNDWGPLPAKVLDGRSSQLDLVGCPRTWVVVAVFYGTAVERQIVDEFASQPNEILTSTERFDKVDTLLYVRR